MIIRNKKYAPIFAVILLLFALYLSACSKSQGIEENTEEIVETQTNDIVGDSSTPELDESSDLSSDDNSENNINQKREWMNNVLSNDTDEIKVIVYNYENNKNILVKNGDKVPFSKEDDTLAFLIPGNMISKMTHSVLFDSAYFTETTDDDGKVSMSTHYFTDPICDEESFLFNISMEVDGKTIDYYVTLNFREGADEKAKEFNIESTLPGLEWIATLDNIITQPTAIIYNDKTNKKVVIEDKDVISLSDPDDVFAYYSPNADAYPLTMDGTFSHIFEKSWVGSDELPDVLNSTRKILCYQTKLIEGSTYQDAMVSGCSESISIPVTFDSSGIPESSIEFSIYTAY